MILHLHTEFFKKDFDYEKGCFYYNKDDNIHKSKALKWKDKGTLTLVECQN